LTAVSPGATMIIMIDTIIGLPSDTHAETTAMETVSAVELRKNLGKFLNLVALTGAEVTIERSGQKIARLVPCETKGRPAQAKMDFRRTRGLGKHLWRKVDSKTYVARERDEWD